MTEPARDVLLDFLDAQAPRFRRIAAATSREWSAEDVRNEAWLLAFDIGQRRGRPLDPADADDAQLLLSHLYNHCVRYRERVVRHATRIDHAPPGMDEDAPHPVAARLVADDGEHPELLLEALQAAPPEQRDAPRPRTRRRRHGSGCFSVSVAACPTWPRSCVSHCRGATRAAAARCPWRRRRLRCPAPPSPAAASPCSPGAHSSCRHAGRAASIRASSGWISGSALASPNAGSSGCSDPGVALARA